MDDEVCGLVIDNGWVHFTDDMNLYLPDHEVLINSTT